MVSTQFLLQQITLDPVGGVYKLPIRERHLDLPIESRFSTRCGGGKNGMVKNLPGNEAGSAMLMYAMTLFLAATACIYGLLAQIINSF